MFDRRFKGFEISTTEDELVLSRCDTLVWLDLPRWHVMTTITIRTLWRALTRERLFHGNVENWRQVLSSESMIVWAWRSYPRLRRRYAAMFESAAHFDRTRIRLRSCGEANQWLDGLRRTH